MTELKWIHPIKNLSGHHAIFYCVTNHCLIHKLFFWGCVFFVTFFMYVYKISTIQDLFIMQNFIKKKKKKLKDTYTLVADIQW